MLLFGRKIANIKYVDSSGNSKIEKILKVES
jgi:hypothetical protein